MSTPRRLLRNEDGTLVTWLLASLVMVFALGGISVDLWRAFSDRRAVAAVADAAAGAAASAVDQEHLRLTGEWRLDPNQARQRAQTSLAQHPALIDSGVTIVAPDATSVTVTTTRYVPFTLLRLLGLDGRNVTAAATAQPGPRH